MAKKVESRAESYLKAYERYFKLMEDAQDAGDMQRLLRNLENAIEAWIGYSEAAVSKLIRDGREEQLAKLIDWYDAIKDQEEAPPPPPATQRREDGPQAAREAVARRRKARRTSGISFPLSAPRSASRTSPGWKTSRKTSA